MASSVGSLNVQLGANTSDFDAKMTAARTEIERLQKAGVSAGAGMAKMGSNVVKMGSSFNQSRFAMQNAAYQVGDFAVQVAGGTSAVRAMSQQMPQLLGAFGLYGALAGAAFAIVAPLAGKLLEASDGAAELTKQTKTLGEASSGYISALSLTQTSVRDVTAEYGLWAAAIIKVRDAQLGLQQLALDDSVKALESTLAEMMSATVRTVEMIRANEGILGAGVDDMQTQEYLLQVTEATEVLNDTLGMTRDQAEGLVAAIQAFKTADGVQAQAEASLALLAALDATRDTSGDMPERFEAVYASTIDISESLIKAADATDDAANAARDNLDPALRGAAGTAADLAFNVAKIADAIRSVQQAETYVANATTIGAYQLYGATRRAAPATPPVASGDGVGRSSGRGKVDAGLREAEALFAKTRTEAEKYADEVERINDLHRQFPQIITDDVKNRALSTLSDAYDEGADKAAIFADAQADLKDGLLDAIIAGEDFADTMSNVAASIAKAALESALFGTGTGGTGLLGGIIGTIFGGFRAGGGSVAGGKSYVVGENGPELLVAGSSGQIIPNSALHDAGGGGMVDVRVSVDNNGNLAAFVERISGSVAAQTTRAGIDHYDRAMLPTRMAQVSRDPRRRG